MHSGFDGNPSARGIRIEDGYGNIESRRATPVQRCRRGKTELRALTERPVPIQGVGFGRSRIREIRGNR
jgi:hypothetical protein